YGVLLDNDPGWKERGKQFSSKVQDLTEFLVNTGMNFAPGQADSELRVTYHDACHLAHAQRITKAPRELVRAAAGKNFIELPASKERPEAPKDGCLDCVG